MLQKLDNINQIIIGKDTIYKNQLYVYQAYIDDVNYNSLIS